MKTLPELKSFCQENLLTDLKSFEDKRKIVRNEITIVSIIVLLVICFLVNLFFTAYLNFHIKSAQTSILNIFVLLLTFIGCLWFWVIFYSSSTETYASGFKTKIIKQIIDFIDNDLIYSQYADTQATLAAFNHSQLFYSSIEANIIRQDDCVSGKIAGIDIHFSEICAEAELKHHWLSYLYFTDILNFSVLALLVVIIALIFKVFNGNFYIFTRILKGQRIDYYHFVEEILKNNVYKKHIFKGIFFQANFNKKIKGETVVIPAILDYKFLALNKERGQVIKLEDPEFNNLFVVYGSDQVEARYALSTSLMANLVKFRKKAKRNIYVSFVESKIYIAVECAEDLFEPRLFKTMFSFAPIREYFEILQLMIGVVEELNLNRRIWSKE